MPKWLSDIITYARPPLLGIAGFFGTQWGLRMAGAEIPTWVLFIIAAGLGIAAIFLERIAIWLVNLYQNKKLKYLVVGISLLISVAWLGWPWQRIQNFFAEIKLKQPIISETWMSEQDAEQFIIKKLQNESGREVFDRRVRYLLKWQTDLEIMGRFKCKGDSTWQRLYRDELIKIPNLDEYDGAKRLSEFIGCTIQYSTESIYRVDWVKRDKESRVNPPNPESSGSH